MSKILNKYLNLCKEEERIERCVGLVSFSLDVLILRTINMKRYCKNINIENYDLIKDAIIECLNEKTERKDVQRFCTALIPVPKPQDMGWYRYYKVNIDYLVIFFQEKIRNKDYSFPPIKYSTVYDHGSEKEREIGVQNIEQQIFDYIAVKGLGPIFKRLGEFQCASVQGRGQMYAQKHIQRWMREKNIKYGVKLDVRKYYENIDREKLMAFLHKYVKNEPLLELVNALISTFKRGLSIGSYLSQYLANLYLSQLYHSIAETYCRIRHTKHNGNIRVRLIKHVLFYMDDILLLGSDKTDMKKAIKQIIDEAARMGLEIKDNWKIITFNDTTFIPMVGLRFYKGNTTIRRRTYKRIRRAYLTIKKRLCKNKHISLIWHYRIIAYYGYILYSSSSKIKRKYHTTEVFNFSKRVISNAARSRTIQYQAACCQNYA